MKVRSLLVAVAIVAITAMVTTRVVSQNKDDGKQPGGQPPMDPKMAKMMEACTKAGMVGPQHKALEVFAGDWNCVCEAVMMPGTPAMKSTGTNQSKSIFGGRYITSAYKGKMGEEDFEGMGILGYDNIKKKYFNTWIDGCGTGIHVSWGTADASGKKYTFNTTQDCPMTGKPMPVKTVYTIKNNSTINFEYWTEDPDAAGKMYKCLDITYTRK